MSSFHNVSFINNRFPQRESYLNQQRLIIIRRQEAAKHVEILRRQAKAQRKHEKMLKHHAEIRRQDEIRRQETLNHRIEINLRRDNLYNIFSNIFPENIEFENIEFENIQSYNNTTLDIDKFAKMNEVKYKSLNNDRCPICYEDFNINESVIVLDCEHNYHNNCIKKWLCECANTCPLCKNEII